MNKVKEEGSFGNALKRKERGSLGTEGSTCLFEDILSINIQIRVE